MPEAWDRGAWRQLERSMLERLAPSASEQAARSGIVRGSRAILRSFSSSFFLVTRFLPKRKRSDVEVIYAAVRYPDEIVDTFPLTPQQRLEMLGDWERWYYLALRQETIGRRLSTGVPWILTGFADVVLRNGIPRWHYLSFLDAMRRDARPRPFTDLTDLIDNYIFGSAVVVGYFLAYVYGPARGRALEEALLSSRELGIALQLTNFARDVSEDARRGRLYLPLDLLRSEGLNRDDYLLPENVRALRRAIAAMAEDAERRYGYAAKTLDAFSPDCRPAIRACIDVYRRLNTKLLAGGADAVVVRQSVPASEKFRALPPSKYWRVPLAYLGAL